MGSRSHCLFISRGNVMHAHGRNHKDAGLLVAGGREEIGAGLMSGTRFDRHAVM